MSLMRGKQKRKGKENPKSKDHNSAVNAQNTETTDCVAFWDREIPEMNTFGVDYTVQRSEAVSIPVSCDDGSVGRKKKKE